MGLKSFLGLAFRGDLDHEVSKLQIQIGNATTQLETLTTQQAALLELVRSMLTQTPFDTLTEQVLKVLQSSGHDATLEAGLIFHGQKELEQHKNIVVQAISYKARINDAKKEITVIDSEIKRQKRRLSTATSSIEKSRAKLTVNPSLALQVNAKEYSDELARIEVQIKQEEKNFTRVSELFEGLTKRIGALEVSFNPEGDVRTVQMLDRSLRGLVMNHNVILDLQTDMGLLRSRIRRYQDFITKVSEVVLGYQAELSYLQNLLKQVIESLSHMRKSLSTIAVAVGREGIKEASLRARIIPILNQISMLNTSLINNFRLFYGTEYKQFYYHDDEAVATFFHELGQDANSRRILLTRMDAIDKTAKSNYDKFCQIVDSANVLEQQILTYDATLVQKNAFKNEFMSTTVTKSIQVLRRQADEYRRLGWERASRDLRNRIPNPPRSFHDAGGRDFIRDIQTYLLFFAIQSLSEVSAALDRYLKEELAQENQQKLL